jgi:hypothetical protein
MTDVPRGFDCRNCGHHVTGEDADRHGWCQACRAVLVRRSAWLAVIPSLIVLAAYLWVLNRFGLFQSTFLIVFIALGAALTWVAFKVARRVLFDVIRTRGVKPPTT